MGFPGGSDGKETACNAEDLGLITGLGRSPGEENGYSLQYSSLENSTDRGDWRAIVHGIAKTQTLLSDFHFFIIKITITSVPSSTCMISFHPTKTLQIRYYRLHCWDRGTEAQKEWVQDQTAGMWRTQIQTQLCPTPEPILLIMKWSHSLQKPPAQYSAPNIAKATGYHSIVSEDLPAGGAVMPSRSTSFILKGFEKGSKDTDLGTKCRLCSGVVWVLHTEACSTNVEPYLPPLNQSQKLAPRCLDTCMDRQAVSSGLTSCLALLVSQFHHLATSLGPPACTCSWTQSQGTLPRRAISQWLPGDFLDMVIPRVPYECGCCEQREIFSHWVADREWVEQGVVVLVLNQRWAWGEAHWCLPVLYLSSTDPGQSEFPFSSLAKAAEDIQGWGVSSHFAFPFEYYSEVRPCWVIRLQKATNGWIKEWPNFTVRGKGKTLNLGSFYSIRSSVPGHFTYTVHHYECSSTWTLNTQPGSSWWQWMGYSFHPQ